MSIVFECNKNELLSAIKHLRVALPKGKKKRLGTILEMNILPGRAKLSIIGASYTLNCTSQTYTKVVLPFLYIVNLVKSWGKENFKMQIEDGLINCSTTTIQSSMIKIIHPENQRSIDLTMNYSKKDLINLRKTHSFDELERVNLLKIIEMVEEELENNLMKAYLLLKDFGVTLKDLEDFVKKIIEH
jgi:hypothetical protein